MTKIVMVKVVIIVIMIVIITLKVKVQKMLYTKNKPSMLVNYKTIIL